MVSVASGDKIAAQFVVPAAVSVTHSGTRAIEAFDRHVGRLENQLRARDMEGIDQILGDFGLPIHRNAAASQRFEVDPDATAGKGETDAVVHQAIFEHPLADLGLHEQVNRSLLQHAGADARGHVLSTLALQNDVSDALERQQPREQQTGGTGTDNGHLSTRHARASRRGLGPSLAAAISRKRTIPMSTGTYPPRCWRRNSCGDRPLWRRKKREK